MLKYFDQGGNFVRMISEIEYENLQITRTLSDGDKTLSFSYLGKYTDLSLEGYIETDDDRYVVKEIVPKSGSADYKCQLDVEPLEASTIRQFTAKDKTIQLAANAALVGTGWTCSVDSGIATKVRSVQQFNKTPFELLLKIRDAFMCEIKFDSKTKVVSYKEQYGSDRGVYLRPELNLVDVSLTLDSYDFYTRIIPVGENGLTIESVNQGRIYVENYQYSTKIRTLYWEDTNYTDAQALKDDAIRKLEDLSKPKRSYSVQVRDLAKLSADYGILDYDIGDTVTITDEPSGIRDKQRIVSITEYPEDPERNTVELSNTVLTWEEYQSRLEAAANAWEDVSNADGSINGVYVHGVQAGDVVKVQVDVNGQTVERNLNQAVGIVQSDINAVEMRVGTVETTYLQATMANIDTANINTAKIKDLFVQVGFIRDAVIDGARITGYLDAVSVNAASITAGTLVADRIAIRGSNTALVYALNNYGQIVSSEVNTLDGYIVTPRTIEADKIVAHSITATEITTQNLVGTNGWINLSSGTFAYGVDKLTWDGSTLNVKGVVEATSGKLGAWTLTDHNFYASANNTATGGVERWTGMQVPGNGNIAITVGATAYGNWATAPFYVTHAGVMHASGAVISGTLTAGANSVIGPWTVTTTSIYKTSSTWGSSTAGAAYFGNSGISITDNFKVSAAGVLTASGATITGTSTLGGWTLTTTQLYASANNINTGNVTRWTGLQIPGNGDWAIAIGVTDYNRWATAPFRVNHKGELFATGADISGVIEATSGKLGNWTLNSSSIKATANNANTGNVNRTTGLQWPGSGVWAIAVGATNEDSWVTAPFRVNHKGEFIATSATITGSVTATDGRIGPWDISSAGLVAANGGGETQIQPAQILLASAGSSAYSTLTGSTLTIRNSSFNSNLTHRRLFFSGSVGTGTGTGVDVLFGLGNGTSWNVGIYDQSLGGWIIAHSKQNNKTSLPYYTSSDIRIKTDIAKSKVNALDAIRRMDVVEFKKNGIYQPIGMIADWLQEIDPLLAEGGGYDEEGNMQIKYIDMFYLQGYLVKAIQELADQLDQLRRTASWKS